MEENSLHFISWNVANRVKRQLEQLQAILQREPNIIALQEVTARTAQLWRKGLAENGFGHVVTSFDLAMDSSVLTGARRYGLLVASHWPFEALSPTEFDIPWTERVLSVSLHSPWGRLECHTAHIPPGASHKWLKIETFEGIFKRLARHSEFPRILCGDFNSPQAEKTDG